RNLGVESVAIEGVGSADLVFAARILHQRVECESFVRTPLSAQRKSRRRQVQASSDAGNPACLCQTAEKISLTGRGQLQGRQQVSRSHDLAAGHTDIGEKQSFDLTQALFHACKLHRGKSSIKRFTKNRVQPRRNDYPTRCDAGKRETNYTKRIFSRQF